MSFTDTQTKALQAPLNSSNVKGRSQGGRQVSYIEGWHAISEANRIFGFDKWDRETIDLRQLGDPREVNGNMRVGYSVRVRITVTTEDGSKVVREGCGFGQGIDKDPDQAHESALKEAETDAMKRALMTFGNPFGLALYDKAQANVIDPAQQALVDKSEAALLAAIKAINEAPDLDVAQKAFGPAWKAMATPDQQARIKATYDARKAVLTAAQDDFPGGDAQQQAA